MWLIQKSGALHFLYGHVEMLKRLSEVPHPASAREDRASLNMRSRCTE